MLSLKDNKAYTIGIPDGDQMDSEVRLGKDRLVKVSKKEVLSIDNTKKEPSKRFKKPTLSEIKAYCEERNNDIDPENFFNFYESKGWVVGKSPMKDWKAAIRTWERKDGKKPKKEEGFKITKFDVV